MPNRPDKHIRIGELVGEPYEPRGHGKGEAFLSKHLEAICEALDLETDGNIGRKKYRIAEEVGIYWPYSKNHTKPRYFNYEDLEDIIEALEERLEVAEA